MEGADLPHEGTGSGVAIVAVGGDPERDALTVATCMQVLLVCGRTLISYDVAVEIGDEADVEIGLRDTRQVSALRVVVETAKVLEHQHPQAQATKRERELLAVAGQRLHVA